MTVRRGAGHRCFAMNAFNTAPGETCQSLRALMVTRKVQHRGCWPHQQCLHTLVAALASPSQHAVLEKCFNRGISVFWPGSVDSPSGDPFNQIIERQIAHSMGFHG